MKIMLVVMLIVNMMMAILPTKAKVDMVRVIVELDDPSIIEAGLELGRPEARVHEEMLQEGQDAFVANAMTKTHSIGPNVNVLASFVNVMNGVALEVPMEQVEPLQQIPGVKQVYAAQRYALPNVIEGAEGFKDMERLGLSGEGMVIGIIDSGLDTSHEAFAKDPLSPRITSKIESDALGAKGDTFKSLKVPFAYDYSGNNGIYSGPDDDVRGGHAHGTHVSGIVAANSNILKGVAPEAQIAFFKVFPDAGSYTDDVYIISALEDAVIVHPDVINMSLGEPCGFTHGLHGALSSAYKVYENIASLGIVMCMSAGNEGRFGLAEQLNTAMVDTATIGSPALYPAPLAVGSLEGNVVVSDNFTVDGKTILYNDYALEESQFFSNLAPGEYIVVPGQGVAKDYGGLDVTGKIVVVSRDGSTIDKKQSVAKQMGACGLVICDTQEGIAEITVAKDGIPCVMVTKDNGKILLEAKNKVLEQIRKATKFINPDAGEISDFSSWGPTSDLTIKPEILGVGGHVYSSLPGSRYGDMSGTSMASPYVAAEALLCAQWLRKTGAKTDSETLVSILMSNATVIKEENESSVRAQGAGIVSLAHVLQSQAYLRVEGKRPKIELGMDKEKKGVYDLDFTIHNLSKTPKKYTVSVSVMCDECDNGRLTTKTHRLSPEVEKKDIVVEKKADAHVRIRLSQEDVNYLAQFENGDFIEGYVYLTDQDGNELSLPFLAYYGDWKQINAIDAPGSQAIKRPFGIMSYMGFREGTNGNEYSLAGMNVYDPDYSIFDDIDEHFITISAEGLVTNVKKNTGIYAISGAWARNIEWCGYEIRNHATGEVYAQAEQEGQQARSYGEGVPILMNVSWKARDASGKLLPDGTVLDVVLRARTNIDDPSSETSRTVHATVDSSAPTIVGEAVLEKIGAKSFFSFDAQDNMCLAAVDLLDENGNILERKLFHEPAQGKIHSISFDVTGMKLDAYIVELHDYTRFTKKYTLKDLSVVDGTLTLVSPKESIEAGTSIELRAEDGAGHVLAPELLQWRIEGNTSKNTVINNGILEVAKNEQSNVLSIYAERGARSVSMQVNVKRYFHIEAEGVFHGTVELSCQGDVLEGTRVTVRALPDDGYQLDTCLVNGKKIQGDSFIVQEDAVVTARFIQVKYDVNVTIIGNGSVEPDTTQSGMTNEKIEYIARPDEGWRLRAVYVDETEIRTQDNHFTIVLGTKPMDVRVVFEEITYLVTVEASNGGKIEPGGTFVAKENEMIRFSLFPGEGYEASKALVNGAHVDVDNNAFSVTVKGETHIAVSFAKIRHVLRIEYEGMGSLDPNGTLLIAHGETQRITLKAEEGNVLSKVYVDGKEMDAKRGFIDVKVLADMEVKAVFRLLNLEFIHVGEKDYWYENGKRQAVAGDVKNIWDKTYGIERGREIYDPASDGWYWLDCVFDGAKAASKEVWMPYLFQDDLASGRNPEGKWVRYDKNGKMIKGWYTVKKDDVALYPTQAGNTYYYDLITGAMCKGLCIIDGHEYRFDETTGVLLK